MVPATERRQHRRLPLRLPLAYRPADAGRPATRSAETANAYTGRAVTSNISTMGVYFVSGDASLHEGMALDLRLTVPPAPGVSPYETEVSTAGEIVRLLRPSSNACPAPNEPAPNGVAVRFNRPLQYDFPK